MEDKRIEETADKKLCPFCGKRVVVEAYVEGGGMGDWCPLCEKSIPRIKEEAELTNKWLSFWVFSLIVGQMVTIILATIVYPAVYPINYKYSFEIRTLNDVFDIILLAYNFVVGIGLYKRRLWAWKANWIIIIFPLGSIICLLVYYLITFTLGKFEIPKYMSPGAYFLFLVTTIITGLLWTSLNYIYFKKRKILFS